MTVWTNTNIFYILSFQSWLKTEQRKMRTRFSAKHGSTQNCKIYIWHLNCNLTANIILATCNTFIQLADNSFLFCICIIYRLATCFTLFVAPSSGELYYLLKCVIMVSYFQQRKLTSFYFVAEGIPGLDVQHDSAIQAGLTADQTLLLLLWSGRTEVPILSSSPSVCRRANFFMHRFVFDLFIH